MQISRIVNKEINESGASRGEEETDLEEDDDEVEEEEEVQEVEEGDDSDDEDDNTLKVVLKTDTGLESVWLPVSNHLNKHSCSHVVDLTMSTILDAIDEAQDRRKEAEEQGQSPLVVSPRGQSQSNTVDVKLVASSVGEINNNDILIANAASRVIFAYGVSPTLQALRTSTV
jgi:hypothetical protein